MACPYFYPTERFLQALWPHASRLPLGDGLAGRCCADPAGEAVPSQAALENHCNLGYARGQCGRFPGSAGPEAVRFTVSSQENGIVRIYYVLERDHRPYEHGPLEYDTKRRALVALPSSRLLARQAEAYVDSYLRRRLA